MFSRWRNRRFVNAFNEFSTGGVKWKNWSYFDCIQFDNADKYDFPAKWTTTSGLALALCCGKSISQAHCAIKVPVCLLCLFIQIGKRKTLVLIYFRYIGSLALLVMFHPISARYQREFAVNEFWFLASNTHGYCFNALEDSKPINFVTWDRLSNLPIFPKAFRFSHAHQWSSCFAKVIKDGITKRKLQLIFPVQSSLNFSRNFNDAWGALG